MPIFLKKLGRIDYPFFLVALLLCIASVALIYSATYTSESADIREAYRSQLFYIPLALTAFFIIALVDYDIWIRLSLPIFGIGLLLLILVLIPGIGTKTFGSRSWLRFGGIGIQPAELCKFAFILVLAFYLLTREEKIPRFGTFVSVLGILLIPVFLIRLQPDFGSAAVFFPIAFAMMFVAGVRKRYLFVPALLVLAVIVYTYVGVHKLGWTIPGMKPYQMDRIKTFYDPNRDPQGAGWTINQSLIAVGSGGWSGKGWLQGTQNVLGFLPKKIAYNDFIFPVACEEFGFLGGALIILLEGYILLTCIRIGSHARDEAGALIAAGVTAMLFTHVFVNIGMTIKVVPITGIPLPLISYGGSFLVVCLASLGLVQSVWIHRKLY
jgi:rod shape determining protein RodA